MEETQYIVFGVQCYNLVRPKGITRYIGEFQYLEVMLTISDKDDEDIHNIVANKETKGIIKKLHLVLS